MPIDLRMLTNLSPEQRARVLDALALLQGVLGEGEQAKVAEPTWAELWTLYETAEERLPSIGTFRSLAKKYVLPFFGMRLASACDQSAVDTYIRQRRNMKTNRGGPPADGSINLELSLTCRVLSWSKRRKLIAANPLAEMERPEVDNIRSTTLTDDQVNSVAQHMPNKILRALVVVLDETAMRRDEGRELHSTHVDMRRELIQLHHGDTKTRRPRIIPLTPRCLDALWSVWDGREGHVFKNPDTGRPYTASVVRDHWVVAIQAAGIRPVGKDKSVHIHDLRHGRIKKWRQMGIPESTIMAMTGHASRAAFLRYGYTDLTDIERARERMLERAALTSGSHGRKGLLR